MRMEPPPCAESGVFAKTLPLDLFLDRHEHHCKVFPGTTLRKAGGSLHQAVTETENLRLTSTAPHLAPQHPAPPQPERSMQVKGWFDFRRTSVQAIPRAEAGGAQGAHVFCLSVSLWLLTLTRGTHRRSHAACVCSVATGLTGLGRAGRLLTPGSSRHCLAAVPARGGWESHCTSPARQPPGAHALPAAQPPGPRFQKVPCTFLVQRRIFLNVCCCFLV